MAGDTSITLVGNLVDDPVLRFTPSGVAVANFRVASTPRTYDRASGQWRDGDTLFLTCTAWRQMAENVAETCRRGTRVMVHGRFRQRSYETADGQKRTVWEVDANEVGASLRAASAQLTKNAQPPDRDSRPAPATSRQRAPEPGTAGTPDPWRASPTSTGATDPWAPVGDESDTWGAWPPLVDMDGDPPF